MLSRCSLALVATALVAVAAQTALRPAADAQDVKQALSLPGTDVCYMTDEQCIWLSCVLDGQMRQHCGKGLGLAELVQTVKLMRSAGAATGMRVFPGKRTLHEVCREIGALARREQRYEDQGRRQEVAASLQRIRAARNSGASTTEIARLQRELLDRGELSMCARGECARIHARLERLARMLVAGQQVIASQAGARGMTVASYLATRPRSARPPVSAPPR